MKRITVFFIALFILSGCSRVQLATHLAKQALPGGETPASAGYFKVGTPYKIAGRWYYPQESYDLVETGIASWYGPNFHGKQTANGEIFDKYELTAAHRTLQMPSLVRVTNLENGRSLIVRINDRGPYKRGRIIDLSEKAADLLGFRSNGTARVRLEVLKQESIQIATAAKSGRDTSGFEIAANRRQPLPGTAKTVRTASRKVQPGTGREQPRPPATSSAGEYQVASLQNTPPSAPERTVSDQPVSLQTVSREKISEPARLKTRIPGHEKNGKFYPDPVVTEYPVSDTEIFVQAGSFGELSNAQRLGKRLERYNNVKIVPVDLNNKRFYRVRLGPMQTVDMADRLLAMLGRDGYNDSIIIVE